MPTDDEQDNIKRGTVLKYPDEFTGDDHLRERSHPFNAEDSYVKNANVSLLTPSKTDADFAADLKERIIGAYQPLFKVMEEADKKGFGINVQAGKTAMGKFDFAQLQIIKIY